jgi:ribosomal-protein-alanine N-acetyltransferase
MEIKQLFFPDEFPVLSTPRLELKAFKEEDAPAFFRLRSDPQFVKYLSTYPMKELKEAQDFIESILSDFNSQKGISWKITLAGSDQLIGYIGFWRIEKQHLRTEVGFGIAQEFQNKGYMSEALQEILHYGFNTLLMHSTMANIDSRNLVSEQLLRKVGFRLEAQFREDYYFDGEFLDSHIYCLLREDLR